MLAVSRVCLILWIVLRMAATIGRKTAQTGLQKRTVLRTGWYMPVLKVAV